MKTRRAPESINIVAIGNAIWEIGGVKFHTFAILIQGLVVIIYKKIG